MIGDAHPDLVVLGGDDYLQKPFSLDELVARVEAVWPRQGPSPLRGRALRREGDGKGSD